MASETITKFLALCAEDAALKNFAKNRKTSTFFRITDTGDQFFLTFDGGNVSTGLGAPANTADLVLSMTSTVLHNLLTGKLNGEMAVMSGQLYVSDEWRAMDMQGILRDLARLYNQAANN